MVGFIWKCSIVNILGALFLLLPFCLKLSYRLPVWEVTIRSDSLGFFRGRTTKILWILQVFLGLRGSKVGILKYDHEELLKFYPPMEIFHKEPHIEWYQMTICRILSYSFDAEAFLGSCTLSSPLVKLTHICHLPQTHRHNRNQLTSLFHR